MRGLLRFIPKNILCVTKVILSFLARVDNTRISLTGWSYVYTAIVQGYSRVPQIPGIQVFVKHRPVPITKELQAFPPPVPYDIFNTQQKSGQKKRSLIDG